MKLSNFKLITTKGRSIIDRMFYATVDVETGILWWKKKETKEIFKGQFNVFWAFRDSGDFTPGRQAEKLSRAYEAEHNIRF